MAKFGITLEHLNRALQRSTAKKMSKTVNPDEPIAIADSVELPIYQGHLFKRSSLQGLGYQKRYFVLYKSSLIYYPHRRTYEHHIESGKKPGTVVNLDGVYLSKTEYFNQHGARHCFTLHVPHGDNKREEIPLATTCRKSKNLWIELLQEQNPALLPAIGERRNSLPTYIEKIRTMGSSSVRVSRGRKESSPAGLHNFRSQRSHTVSGERH